MPKTQREENNHRQQKSSLLIDKKVIRLWKGRRGELIPNASGMRKGGVSMGLGFATYIVLKVSLNRGPRLF